MRSRARAEREERDREERDRTDTQSPAEDAPEPEISIRGLTKSFGKQTVLEDITCDIPKGKITLMLGPSGTGKSVFLKHVMGLLRPDRGEIWVDGKNLPELSSRELYRVRRKFGVLFQDGALFGSMTIYDNVAFPLREHTKKGEKEIRDIVTEKLTMVGLQGAEDKLPGEISGGMKKRAGLARALVLDPEIVLFDEPDSGLDPVRTAFLNELILDLNRQLGATFIVVTHDIATARRVADYIGMLYLKNLIQFGTNKEMFESEIPAVRQFLAGATKGPIGMSEEADAGRGGPSSEAISTSGMSAEDTERLEREAGAPAEDEARPDARRVTSVSRWQGDEAPASSNGNGHGPTTGGPEGDAGEGDSSISELLTTGSEGSDDEPRETDPGEPAGDLWTDGRSDVIPGWQPPTLAEEEAEEEEGAPDEPPDPRPGDPAEQRASRRLRVRRRAARKAGAAESRGAS